MKKKVLTFAFLSMMAVSSYADVLDTLSYCFSDSLPIPSSVKLLPAPPQPGSAQFLYDQYQYLWGKSQRDTERGDLAASDANETGDGVPNSFSEVYGIQISPATAPEVYALISHMREDFGYLSGYEAKLYYNRIRPFTYYNEQTCNTADQKRLSTNGSYPSGHSAIGWGVALVLAEINVQNQDQILQRGYQMGQSRIICGYHFQSDVDAARMVASAMVARLHACAAFNVQLAKAKAEFAQLAAAGKIKLNSAVKPNYRP